VADAGLEVRSKRYREDFPDPTERARTILEQTNAFLDAWDRSKGAPGSA